MAGVRVVYLMGVGVSGSTLLDAILGTHPDVEGVGELCNVAEQGWVEQRACSCGATSAQCTFWRDVRHLWAERTTPEAELRYSEVLRRLERRRIWLPRLLRWAQAEHPLVREYACWTSELFRAIRDISGKSVIVDSSKRISRALLLAYVPGIDLRVVHLVRDCRGVVWSMRKRNQRIRDAGGRNRIGPQKETREPWFTSAVWMVGNLQGLWLRRRMPEVPAMLLRYEDYLNDLPGSMARIGELIELDLRGVVAAVQAGEPLEKGHRAGGNRLLTGGPIRVRPADMEWAEKMTRFDRTVCWTMAGPLLHHLGYDHSRAA